MGLPGHDTNFCDVPIVSTPPLRSNIILTMRRATDYTIASRTGMNSGPETCSSPASGQSPVNADRDGRRATRTGSQLILAVPVGAIEMSAHLELNRRTHTRRRSYRSPPRTSASTVAPARGIRWTLPEPDDPPLTMDSSPRPLVPPPVACRPNPTTPSRPSAHGHSRCAPRASARSRSRSRWQARGIRSG